MSRGPGRGLIILAAALVAGCGSDPYQTAYVSGRVTTCEGKPAYGGEVIFSPIEASAETGRDPGNPGRGSRGMVGEDGTFTLTLTGDEKVQGALIGRHLVLFKPPATKPPTLTAEERESLAPEELKQMLDEIAKWKPAYPEIPCGNGITPAEVEVVRGSNTFEFTLPPPSSSPATPRAKGKSPR